ncbi:MAG: hypothetical protein NUW24_03490 [Anaerolineae bacterium]|nr:hypothetical protein [Anaerolineae bacterium]MDH7473558.1 hypothetical protein [Anaerolineae bacterium]
MERFWGSEAELGLWIAISIALYVTVTNLDWHMRTGWAGWPGQALRWMKRGRYASWLGEVLRLLYYVGLPYAVIVLRRTGQPAYMGIPPLEGDSLTVSRIVLLLLGLAHPVEAWRTLGPALGLTAGTLVLAAILCWWYARSLCALLPNVASTMSVKPIPWWIAFREAVYLQVHWAFYRSGPILLTGDFYNGTALGLALICLEWFLNPAWRAALRQPFRAEVHLSLLGLALTTALLFSITHLLWLTILVHWVLALIYARHIFPAHLSACAGPLSTNVQRINE